MNRLQKRVERISLIVAIPISILGGILFKDKNVFIGVWLGDLIALIGFRMIIRMAKNLQVDVEDAKKQGNVSYVTRYFFYGAMILLCAIMGVPVLSILAGMMCHKASLIIYTAVEKEDA